MCSIHHSISKKYHISLLPLMWDWGWSQWLLCGHWLHSNHTFPILQLRVGRTLTYKCIFTIKPGLHDETVRVSAPNYQATGKINVPVRTLQNLACFAKQPYPYIGSPNLFNVTWTGDYGFWVAWNDAGYLGRQIKTCADIMIGHLEEDWSTQSKRRQEKF